MPHADPAQFFDAAFLRKLERLAIFSRKAFAGRLRGEQRSRRYGSSVEFADFRPYSQGDDFRRIDWNAYARFGSLFLKLFTEEEDLCLYLLVDASASMGFGEPVTKFDLARRIAAALAYIALANLDRVAILALAQGGGIAAPRPADEGPPAEGVPQAPDHLAFVRGKGSVFQVLDYLAALQPAGRTDLDRGIRDFLGRWRQKGVVVLISDFLNPGGYEDGLKQLVHSGHQPMVVHILAEEELEPTLSGDFRLVDSETGRPVDVSTTRRMLEGYRERARRFADGLDRFCTQSNVAHVRTTTAADFDDLILSALRRAAVVR